MNPETNPQTDDRNPETNQLEMIPAFNLLKGQPVTMQKEGCEPLKDKDQNDLDLDDLIEELKGKYDSVYITDINGVVRDKPQLESIKDISSEIKVWVDAGSRYGEGAIDILIAGAEFVVLSTKTLRNIEELENACELSENIAFGIDYDDGIVSPDKDIRNMSIGNVVTEARSIGITRAIFTDLKHLSTDARFNLDKGRQLLNQDVDIYFHGRFVSGRHGFSGIGLSGIIVEVESLL
ncbi:MAG: hypothetical protein JSW28_09355 [Thermoplasmata archaeon]|nr:MAG: hypothetical protein JSW28_09355 [Thermoplasmata archaeon]